MYLLGLFIDAIDDDVSAVGHNELPRAFLATNSASERVTVQELALAAYKGFQAGSGLRVSLEYIGHLVSAIVQSARQPSDDHC